MQKYANQSINRETSHREFTTKFLSQSLNEITNIDRQVILYDFRVWVIFPNTGFDQPEHVFHFCYIFTPVIFYFSLPFISMASLFIFDIREFTGKATHKRLIGIPSLEMSFRQAFPKKSLQM